MLTNSVLEKIEYLYPEYDTKEIGKEISVILDKFRVNKKQGINKNGIDEKDCFLITYGDSILSEGKKPLSALLKLFDETINGVVSNIHILPFYPYSSDDGFSVKDYFAVNRELGSWGDIKNISEKYSLMFDGVVNHISAQSDWFKAYLSSEETYKQYFIEADPEADLTQVIRPRALPLLTPFETVDGKKHLWTTFSEDQVDLNFQNPDVFIKILELILFYIEKGASFLRLDAIGFLWKVIGTSCLHLPQTHSVIQLYRELIELVTEGFIFITETNVPHKDNISYFGNGFNEASLVYQFPLPPLILNAMQTENGKYLTEWVKTLKNPSEETCFFNFLASHDGIGLNPVRGIIPEEEILQMAELVKKAGGLVSNKMNPDGTESPYELNISLYDALSKIGESDEINIKRFVLAHAIQFSLAGVPAIYIHSLFGSTNYTEGVEKTGRNRTINREKLNKEMLIGQLNNPGHRRNKIFNLLIKLIKIRTAEPFFHPNGSQKVINRGDSLFMITRSSADEQNKFLGIFNLTGEKEIVTNPFNGYTLINMLNGIEYHYIIEIEPYDFYWLKLKGKK